MTGISVKLSFQAEAFYINVIFLSEYIQKPLFF